MQQINWNANYAVGIAEVDAQHHALIDMINALSSSIGTNEESATTRNLLDRLADYTRLHFSLEERLMSTANIPAEFVTRHRGEHAYFIGVLKDFSADFARGKGRISAPLLEYLLHWLLHHIVVTDREMAKHLHTLSPSFDAKAAAHMAQSTTADLNASEQHLLSDLQHKNADLETRLKACQQELTEALRQLAEKS